MDKELAVVEKPVVPRKPGRPSRKTPDVLETIRVAIDKGGTITDAAEAAGVGRRTIYDWLEQDEDFRDFIELAKLGRRKRLLERIEKRTDEDWRAAAWILERTMPEEFGKNATVHVEGAAPRNLILQKVELSAGDPDHLARVLARLAEAGALPVELTTVGAGEGDYSEVE